MGTKESKIQSADIANYVGAMSHELHQMANAAKLPFLAYLLDMARLAAAEENVRSALRKPIVDNHDAFTRPPPGRRR